MAATKENTLLGMQTATFIILVVVVIVFAVGWKKIKEQYNKLTGSNTTTKDEPKQPTAITGGGGGSPTNTQPTTTLTSAEVSSLQSYLNSKGQSLVVDGIFGSKTAAALKAVTGKDSITSAELKQLTAAHIDSKDQALAVPGSKVKNEFFSNVEYSEINQEGTTSHKVANAGSTIVKKYSKGAKVYPTGYTIDAEPGNEKSRWVELKDGSWVFSSYLTSKPCAWYDITCGSLFGAKSNQVIRLT